MTLVLGFKTSEGVGVIADTRFGSSSKIAADAGPKIFSVPIILNKGDGGPNPEKRHLPNMGFAFAGNTFSGQAAHALASTYLQNLLVAEFDAGPTVAGVAKLYARCAQLVVDERRQWYKSDSHTFEAVIFGRSTPETPSEAFCFDVCIDDAARAQCAVIPVDFSKVILFSLGGAGAPIDAKVRNHVEKGEEIIPWDVLRDIIEDESVPTVGGHLQIAVSTPSGVELRPIFSSAMERDALKIMGFSVADIGILDGRYLPGGTHAAIGRPVSRPS